MIIDVHCHLWDEKVPSRLWFQAMVRYGVAVSGSSEEKVRQKILDGQFDVSGDLLIHDMDEAGIDKGAIHVMDLGLFAGVGIDDAVSLERQHQIFFEAVERYPNRLFAFAGVDPRRPDAVGLIKRAVREWKMKGVKLWTPSGFYPNDKQAYRLYAACEELGLPVWVHSGPEIAPFYMGNTQPKFIDEVASDFPNLRIVIAHSGDHWWREAAIIANAKPNAFLDIASWQVSFLHSSPRFYREFRDLVNIAGPSKVMFGSDWPATRLVQSINLANWVETIKQLSGEGVMGVRFSESEISAILGGNARRLLGL